MIRAARIRFPIPCIAFLLVMSRLPGAAQAGQDPARVFEDPKEKDRMFAAYFERMCSPESEGPASDENRESYRAGMRKRVMQCLGLDPLPERIPLDARIVAAKEYGDYRIERVWFRTFPDVWAAGWLYVPKAGPGGLRNLPAIINLNGHWPWRALNEVEQARGMAMAMKGFAAFSVDSADHESGFPSGLSWPTGLCPAGIMTWNAMRAIDYLLTRPEIDGSRIGCTGGSGGGLQTLFLTAADDRIQAAVPAVMVCRYRRILFPDENAHCFCNHVPGLLKAADMPAIAALFAPKPILFLCSRQDWTAGFQEEDFPRIRELYRKLGSPEKSECMVFDLPHGYHKPMREAAYAWFNRWLRNVTDSAESAEPRLRIENPNLLGWLDYKLPENRGTEGILAYFRRTVTSGFGSADSDSAGLAACLERLRGRLPGLLGEDTAIDAKIGVARKGSVEWRGRTVEKLAYSSEKEFEIPALLIRPKGAEQPVPVAILLAEKGKKDVIENHWKLVEGLLDAGIAVFAPDFRGAGELQVSWDLNSIVWGRPVAGMGAHDVLRGLDALSSMPAIAGRWIWCAGLDRAGSIVALLCGALDTRIGAVASLDAGPAYRAGRERPFIPNILRFGDVPEAAALAAPRPLYLNKAEPAADYAVVGRAYKNAGAEENLAIANLDRDEAESAFKAWIAKISAGR